MVDTTVVNSEQEFVEAIVANDDLDLTDSGAEELWRIWTYRYENGATDDVLVALPRWLAKDNFGREWPCFFGTVEYDEDEKDAVLFTDARLIDINVVVNEIWDDVTITEALETVDLTDDEDFPMDEKGEIWSPRSYMAVYERGD
jgi:hypothetical protein